MPSSTTCAFAAEEHIGVEDDVGDALEEKGFSIVSTKALEAQGLTPHPDPIAETATLASVPPPTAPYRVALPTEVLIRECFRGHVLAIAVDLALVAELASVPLQRVPTHLTFSDLGEDASHTYASYWSFIAF